MSKTNGSPTFNNTIVESFPVHEHDEMVSDEDPSFEVIPRPDTPITQATNLEGSGLLNINFTVVESLSPQSLFVPNFLNAGSSSAESLRVNYEPVPGSYEVADPIPDEDNTSLLTDSVSTKHSDSLKMTSLLQGTHELLNSIQNFANSTNDVSVSQLLSDVDALVETNKRLHDDLRKAENKTQDAEATAKELFAAQERRIKELEQKVQELTTGSRTVANEKDVEKNSALYDLIQSLWSLSVSVVHEVCLQAIPEYTMDANIRSQLRKAQLSATKTHLAIQNTSNSAESILRQTSALESKRRQKQASLTTPEIVAETSQLLSENEAKSITERQQVAIEQSPNNPQLAIEQRASSKTQENAEAREIAEPPQASTSTDSAPPESYVAVDASTVEPSPVKTAVSESSMTGEVAITTKSPVDSMWEFATLQQQGSENVGVGIYIQPNPRLSTLETTSTTDAPVRSEFPASLEAVNETHQLVPKVPEKDPI